MISLLLAASVAAGVNDNQTVVCGEVNRVGEFLDKSQAIVQLREFVIDTAEGCAVCAFLLQNVVG
jgi:hypothetical protein